MSLLTDVALACRCWLVCALMWQYAMVCHHGSGFFLLGFVLYIERLEDFFFQD